MYVLRKINIFSQRGYSLVEALVTMGIMSAVALSFSTLFHNMNKQLKLIESKNTIMSLKDSVRAVLTDETSWQLTVENLTNTSLNCLKESASAGGYDCASQFNKDGEIKVLMSGSATSPYVAYRTGKSSGTNFWGFNKIGSECNDFNDNGNPNCPIKMAITWKPQCGSAAACKSPFIRVDVKFEFNQGNSGEHYGINAARHNFFISRPGRSHTVEEVCTSLGGALNGSGDCEISITQEQCTDLGGTFNKATGQCSLLSATCASLGGTLSGAKCNLPSGSLSGAGLCAAGTIMTGIAKDGSPKCTSLETMMNTVNNPDVLPPGTLAGWCNGGVANCQAKKPGKCAQGGCQCETGWTKIVVSTSVAGPGAVTSEVICRKN